MKNFSLVFVLTLTLFFLINLAINITWPIYSKLKINKHNYPKETVEVLNLSEEDMNILSEETWKSYDKFTYVPFIGHSETKREGKFVNFDQKNGRKISRPNNCTQNVVMYGGSTTFGYNVSDKETISQKLQNLLGQDYCVFNHGRAYFYSKQENNLFTLHIENNYKIDHAIFLDGVNERCGGYEYDRHINRSFQILVERPYKMWQKTFVDFVYTLPIAQLSNSLFSNSRWIGLNDENLAIENRLVIDSCKNNISLAKLFEKRLNLRHSLCSEEQIKCYSFLQPFAGTHGKQVKKYLENYKKTVLEKKYNSLKMVKKYVIDIGYVLSNSNELAYIDELKKGDKVSYVDGTHYSPQSSSIIAEAMLPYILN